MVGIAAFLPRMFQNTLNTITQRNRKYKLAQTAAKIIKAYWVKLRKKSNMETYKITVFTRDIFGKMKTKKNAWARCSKSLELNLSFKRTLPFFVESKIANKSTKVCGC